METCGFMMVLGCCGPGGVVLAELLLAYVLLINLVAFFVYGIDKWRARKGAWRIKESVLLLLAFAGGSIGALLGIRVWHHKTLHPKFRYGVPLILVVQLMAVAFLAYKFL